MEIGIGGIPWVTQVFALGKRLGHFCKIDAEVPTMAGFLWRKALRACQVPRCEFGLFARVRLGVEVSITEFGVLVHRLDLSMMAPSLEHSHFHMG